MGRLDAVGAAASSPVGSSTAAELPPAEGDGHPPFAALPLPLVCLRVSSAKSSSSSQETSYPLLPAAAVGVPTVAYLLGQTVTPPAPGDGRLAARPDDDEGASSARSA